MADDSQRTADHPAAAMVLSTGLAHRPPTQWLVVGAQIQRMKPGAPNRSGWGSPHTCGWFAPQATARASWSALKKRLRTFSNLCPLRPLAQSAVQPLAVIELAGDLSNGRFTPVRSRKRAGAAKSHRRRFQTPGRDCRTSLAAPHICSTAVPVTHPGFRGLNFGRRLHY